MPPSPTSSHVTVSPAGPGELPALAWVQAVGAAGVFCVVWRSRVLQSIFS